MGDLPILANRDYLDRVNRGIDHVVQNLAGELKLEDVAKAACFSPFHFHRVFKTLMGETLHDFVKRVRLERAVFLLSHREKPALTEVALACGFGSSSDFSRSFKARFGVAPRDFDVAAFRDARREEMMAGLPNGHRLQRLPVGENPDGFVATVRSLPARRVAYLRIFKAYGGPGAKETVERMLAWADAHGLAGGQWLGYQWDDPEIVPLDQCRYDIGVEVPEDAVLGPDVSEVRFPAMRVAECGMKGPIELEMRLIDWLYRTWLPASGFAPDAQPAFEAWDGRPFAHAPAHFELRFHLPVVDAAAPI